MRVRLSRSYGLTEHTTPGLHVIAGPPRQEADTSYPSGTEGTYAPPGALYSSQNPM